MLDVGCRCCIYSEINATDDGNRPYSNLDRSSADIYTILENLVLLLSNHIAGRHVMKMESLFMRLIVQPHGCRCGLERCTTNLHSPSSHLDLMQTHTDAEATG